jgi:hypothetical protein
MRTSENSVSPRCTYHAVTRCSAVCAAHPQGNELPRILYRRSSSRNSPSKTLGEYGMYLGPRRASWPRYGDAHLPGTDQGSSRTRRVFVGEGGEPSSLPLRCSVRPTQLGSASLPNFLEPSQDEVPRTVNQEAASYRSSRTTCSNVPDPTIALTVPRSPNGRSSTST